MTASFTFRGKRIVVRFNGFYVGAYTSMDAAEAALDAYRGVTR
jgi:hypothetical protein